MSIRLFNPFNPVRCIRYIPYRIATFQVLQHRKYINTQSEVKHSNSDQLTENQAKEKANMLIQMLPGDTLFKKTAFTTIGGSLLAIAIANDLYIPNHETPILAAFLLFVRLVQLKLGPLITEFAEKGLAELRSFWEDKFFGQKKVLQETLRHLEKFQNQQQILDEYIRIKKENVSLEKELNDLLSTNKHLQSIKSKLEDKVRKLQEEREQERKQLLDALLERVMSDLKDPKFQDTIMKQCLVDLEKIGIQNQDIGITS